MVSSWAEQSLKRKTTRLFTRSARADLDQLAVCQRRAFEQTKDEESGDAPPDGARTLARPRERPPASAVSRMKTPLQRAQILH
jgi:hypothetical protein